MRDNPGAQYEISVDGVPRTHRDRQDIALQTARFLKSQNPNSVVKMKDLRTGDETVVVFPPLQREILCDLKSWLIGSRPARGG